MKSSSHKNNLKKKDRRRGQSHQKSESRKRRRKPSLSVSDDDLSLSYSDSDDSRTFSSSSDSEYDFHRKRKRGNHASSSSGKRGRSSPRRDDGHRKKNKKKKSKGHSVSEARKTKTSKKRRRRARSMSSDSYSSCSTCGSYSSSDSGRRDHSRSRKREKLKLSERGRKRYRSRSSSPSCSECMCQSSEERLRETFPKRLNSVVTVVKKSSDTELLDSTKDEKAEIIQAYDDCPSSRSNDSCEDGKKREGAKIIDVHGDLVEFEGSGQVDRTANCSVSGANSSQKDAISCGTGLAWTEVHKNPVDSKVDAMELRLRIKALENFTKFRRAIVENAKSLVDQKDVSSVPRQLTAKADSAQKAESAMILPDGKSASKIEEHENSHNDNSAHSTRATLETNQVCSAHSRMSIAGNVTGAFSKCSPVILKLKHSSSVTAGSAEFSQVNDHKTVSGTSACVRENVVIPKQSPRIPNSSSKCLLEKVLDENVSETGKGKLECKLDMDGAEVKKGDEVAAKPSSSCNESSDHDLKEQKVEDAKDGSHFEQKTMSVMRGGEMVQVSYKVYIPKRAPALARRQLKR